MGNCKINLHHIIHNVWCLETWFGQRLSDIIPAPIDLHVNFIWIHLKHIVLCWIYASSLYWESTVSMIWPIQQNRAFSSLHRGDLTWSRLVVKKKITAVGGVFYFGLSGQNCRELKITANRILTVHIELITVHIEP